MSARDLARILGADQQFQPLALRQATVMRTGTGPASVTISIAGSAMLIEHVRYLAGYSPAAQDTVWVLQNGPDLLVLGRLAT